MSSSLRSQPPDAAQGVQDAFSLPPWGLDHRNEVWPDKNWTPIPYKGWIIFVAGKGQSVKITHFQCGGVQWWGPLFHKTDGCGEVCAYCKTEIPADIELYLLSAWELYVL